MMTSANAIGSAAGAAATVLLLSALGAPELLTATVAGTAAWLGHSPRWCRRRQLVVAPATAPAQQQVRQREELLANTAHELRTPLTAVTTALELLRDGYATSPEDWHMFLDQATVASRHMTFLINDVVDLAALESGRLSLNLRTLRVPELLFDMAQVMQLTAQSRSVGLRIEEPAEQLLVRADRGRFLQIAFNLIANAIKFSAVQSTVRVTVTATALAVAFEVHDTGPGVDEQNRDRLFTRFGRAHDHSMPAVVGTGLGLHVCKLLVEHMQGRIGFRPGHAGGSVFWFELPRVAVEDAEVARLERAPA